MRKPIALAFVWLGAVGCKQGVGERCAVDSDCDNGLVCATQQHVCTNEQNDVPDAGPLVFPGDAIVAPFRPDAPEVPADARPDARILPDAASNQ